MIIEGENVRLRPATMDDLPAYTRWYTDREFLHYMGNGSDTFSWLQSPRSDQVNFSVETKDGRLIGMAFIIDIRTRNRNCELGVVAIGEPEFRDKGYGTEMVRLALGFCFGELGMHQVHIRTAVFNERARACYAKVFPSHQVHREWVWEDGRFWDEIYFDVTEDEWAAQSG